MERKKHNKDGEIRYIRDSDFQIGCLIKLGAYTFQLLKADDFTINYMRERPERFPEISIQATLKKIQALSSNH